MIIDIYLHSTIFLISESINDIMKKFVVILLLVTVLPFLSISQSASAVDEKGNIVIHVGGVGDVDYTSIQEAIDNASIGDIIYVYSGVYNEHIIIDRKITLAGESRDETIIDGAGLENVIRVNTSFVSIMNFTIINSSGNRAGIYFENVLNSTIKNCNISDNNGGIMFDYSSNNSIIDCFLSNNENGIDIWESTNNEIKNCNILSSENNGIVFFSSSENSISNCSISNNSNGISFDNSLNNKIENCTTYSNGCGIWLERLSENNRIKNCNSSNNAHGIKLASANNILRNNTLWNNNYSFSVHGFDSVKDYYEDVDESNKINGKPIYYVLEQDNLEFNETMDIGFLALVSCSNITIKNINVSYNGHGILLVNTTNSVIENTTFFDNEYGIHLYECTDNKIMNCSISWSSESAIYLWHYSQNNTIENCKLTLNNFGVHLDQSSNK